MHPDRYAFYTKELWPKVNPYISKGENNMNNIKWKVESIEGQTSPYTGGIELTATLNGSLDGDFMGTLDGIAGALQTTLDRENNKLYISTARGCGKYMTQLEIYKELFNSMYGSRKAIYKPYVDPMEIKDVIFNNPATIVFWADGTKTVVKCQEGDEFDPEKGLTMAIAKKIYGNKGSYCNVIKKWTEPYYEKQAETEAMAHEFTIELAGGLLCKNLKDLFEPINAGELKFTFTGTRASEEDDDKKEHYTLATDNGVYPTKKKDPEFVKVTEHYGYEVDTNKDGDLEYYIMHKDRLVNFTDINAPDWIYYTKNRDYAVSMAHYLEYHHYISKGL